MKAECLDVISASSEAIFGSASRGDIDTMSDRDILIVDDDVSVLQRRASALRAEGWSVAPYTFAKLEAVAGKGALFVQHLKLEATILKDQQCRLADLLERFKPLENYRMEIRNNERLAKLGELAPPGKRGALLAADILYVAVRNYGVLSLAERGIHTYAYVSILQALETEGLIRAGGAKALSPLRSLKCLYRAGGHEDGRHVRETVDRALSVLPHGHFPRQLRFVAADQILSEIQPRYTTGPYLQLRDLERRLVALDHLLPGTSRGPEFAKLTKWISNPRAYASLAYRLSPQLRGSLRAKLGRITRAALVRRAA